MKARGAGLGPGGATEPTGCRMRKIGTRARTVRFASGDSLGGGGEGREGTHAAERCWVTLLCSGCFCGKGQA